MADRRLSLGCIGSFQSAEWAVVKRLTKAIVLVVMYECVSWTIKKLNKEELILLNRGVGEDS